MVIYFVVMENMAYGEYMQHITIFAISLVLSLSILVFSIKL